MLVYYLYTLLPLSLLLLKHLIVDFYMQTPYMAQNKGRYGHWGGISHALLHSLGAIIALCLAYMIFNMPMNFFVQWMVEATLILALVDGVTHYHMDWFKTWWCKRKNYKSHVDLGCSMDQCKSYWRWLGIDQVFHTFIYIIMYAGVTAWIRFGQMNLYG